MQLCSIPTCYFPSTVLFVEERSGSLSNRLSKLDGALAYRSFQAPQEALDYIHNKRCELDLVSQHCLTEYNEARHCPLTHHTINSDLAAIHAEIYNPQRFSEISVVVVDDTMPGMDGLEFCRRVENSNIKKILVIDKVDEKKMVEAFHEGLIDRYVKKCDGNAAGLMVTQLVDLQLKYFQMMSDMVVRMLSVTTPACLRDKGFEAFFRHIREENKIVEYYLVEHSGSFFMLDGDANVSFLIVKNKDDLSLCGDEALVNGVAGKALDDLRLGKKIPGLGQPNIPEPRWKDWSNCLVPAKQFSSDQMYYYAYLKGNSLFDVRRQKILSYHRYLEELGAGSEVFSFG